jgi:hypothetical protein
MLRTSACIVFGLALGSCSLLKPPPAKPFEAQVRVFSDPGQPLKGAEIYYKAKRIGVSDEAGVVNFRLKGAEGQVYDLSIKCPAGFQSPAKPLSVTLRKTADPGAKPEYQVDCPPVTRNVVVAVRADSGANLPVMYQGKEIVRTDQSGAAHLLLNVPPNQMFQLQLGTDGDAAKDLRPQNPTATFEVKNEDAVLIFDQKFSIERKRRVYSGKAKSSGPKPL